MVKAYKTNHAYNSHDGDWVYATYAFDCLGLDDCYMDNDTGRARVDFGDIIVSGTCLRSGYQNADEYKGGMDWRREYESL